MSVPDNCKYTKEHEWARQDDSKVVVGITEYAQMELGDVVFVELPEPGASVSAGESFGTVESVKAVSDIYSPVDGTVVEVNENLADSPELLNESPFENGWLVAIEPSDAAQLDALMSPSDYDSLVGELSK